VFGALFLLVLMALSRMRAWMEAPTLGRARGPAQGEVGTEDSLRPPDPPPDRGEVTPSGGVVPDSRPGSGPPDAGGAPR
jgi:hypothetical protein